MVSKAQFRFIFFFILTGLLSTNCQLNHQPEINRETDDNIYRKDFWLKSQHALSEDLFIKVWLPGSYFDTDKKYPVLYITDGDFFFDIAATMAYHLGMNSKEIIVVGIGYGSKKLAWERREFEFLADHLNHENIPGNKLFIDFFKEELFPTLESKFRIETNNRTLFGWSSGFYFACHVLYQERTLFENYILGGGLFPDNWEKSLKLKEGANLKQKRVETPIGIYIGHPGYDAPQESLLKSIEYLEGQNFADLFIKWDIYEGKDHSLPTVVDLIVKGMDYTYHKKPIAPNMLSVVQNKGVKQAIIDYKRWRSNSPEFCDYSPNELKLVAATLSSQGNFEAGRETLKYVEREFPTREITFEVRSEELTDSSSIFIAGNHEAIGNWNPSQIKLLHVTPNRWYKSILFENETNLEFKFTLGSWMNEALNEQGEVFANFKHVVMRDTTLSFIINNWKNK